MNRIAPIIAMSGRWSARQSNRVNCMALARKTCSNATMDNVLRFMPCVMVASIAPIVPMKLLNIVQHRRARRTHFVVDTAHAYRVDVNATGKSIAPMAAMKINRCAVIQRQ